MKVKLEIIIFKCLFQIQQYVLFLRDTYNTPDRMKVTIKVPGDSAEYGVPVIRLAKYSLDDMLKKNVYTC